MKIAIVLHTFPVVSETFIVNQICSLIDNNHEVTIFALNKGDKTIIHQNIKKYNLLDKVKYYNRIPSNKPKRYSYFFKTFFQFVFSRNLLQIFKTVNVFKFGFKALNLQHFYRNQWFLRKNEFDVIHCHFAQLGLFISKLKRDGFLNNEKLITSFHGVDISPNKIKKYQKNYKVLFEYMNVCTYNSKYSFQILQQINSNYLGYKFLPEGLDTNLFKPHYKKRHDDKVNILFCGRLVSFKGPDIAVEIIKRLIKSELEIRLTIIGNGEMFDSLKETIIENNLQNFIFLKGSLSQENIIDAMDQSDVFLLPGIVDSNGRAENQGLVIQEAQSMELPVVVSDAGGMKYGIVNNKTGFAVKSKDIDAFVEKIETLITNNVLRDEMGKEARAYVVKKFDNAVLYNKLVHFYKNA